MATPHCGFSSEHELVLRNGDVCDVCIEIWSKISQIIGLQASNICDCGVGERILSFEPDLGKALDLGKKVGLGM